jgi:glycosyltransferase involved in cell wall biosynthesis
VKEWLDPDVPECHTFADWISRLSTRVVVPSHAVTAAFAIPPDVLAEGDDVAAIEASAGSSSRGEVLRRLDLPVERPMVAQIGSLYEWKGQHVTADAFGRLAGDGEDGFSLLFLGRGDRAYRERVQGILAQSPSAARNVRFATYDADDFGYLAAADVVVHPSVLPDPFPNAVREAMILGKPVIATNAGGIPEMIRPNETGVLIEPGDAGALADALSALLRSRMERERLGAAARDAARAEFDITVRKDAFGDLLDALVRD